MNMARTQPTNAAVMDATDRALINALQGDFPLSRSPFAEVGERLGLGEAQVLERLQRLLRERVLTRFGPMFQIERIGGAFCLAAMAVPEIRFDAVTEQVNAFREVAHNYRRDHSLNMWFVLASEESGGIAECARRIQAVTGLPVFLFPKEREYFVEMKLEA
jgi:DNA-binding Lrp family transcriptional regulator